MLWIILAAIFAANVAHADVSPPRPVAPDHGGTAVVVTGPVEVVFDWSEDNCYVAQIPDLPVRAFRDGDDQVNLILSHTAAHRMRGPDFGSLVLDCAPVSGSRKLPDPESYADQEWIAAVYSEDGQTVHALIHNEFQGNWKSHEVCATRDYFKCWMNSITYARSDDGGATYVALDPPDHLVASLPDRYHPDEGIYGLFSPSNIIKRDGYYYAYLKAQTYPLELQHVCLMRTQALDDPKSWRFWDGRAFEGVFVDPYRDDPNVVERTPNCAPIALPQIAEMYEGITWNTHLGKFVLVGTSSDPTQEPNLFGFYYAFSDDLITWSHRQPLLHARLPWRSDGSQTNYAYPTLIDHQSPSRNFETTGATGYLYLTRNNAGHGSLDRDLLRFPVEFRQPNRGEACEAPPNCRYIAHSIGGRHARTHLPTRPHRHVVGHGPDPPLGP
ncbi:MAG: hypothetical protein GKR99_20335 [Rhodobacteraceae bacterium]|nr:hypothetical protein [Paracoccaceae bacterium]